jgi:hypothetical protein
MEYVDCFSNTLHDWKDKGELWKGRQMFTDFLCFAAPGSLFLVKKFWIISSIAFTIWGWRISVASRVTSYNMTKVISAVLHLKMKVSDDYFNYFTLRAVRDADECTGHKLCALLPQQLSLRTGFLQQAFSKLQHRRAHKCKYGCVYIVFHIEGFFCNILQLTRLAKIYKSRNFMESHLPRTVTWTQKIDE